MRSQIGCVPVGLKLYMLQIHFEYVHLMGKVKQLYS